MSQHKKKITVRVASQTAYHIRETAERLGVKEGSDRVNGLESSPEPVLPLRGAGSGKVLVRPGGNTSPHR